MTLSVIIVTLDRPDCVCRCLGCLANQEILPNQVIVVDASEDERTKRIVGDNPGVVYLRNENGFGRMTRSRNIGLSHVKSDIVAFVDDDAFADREWSKNLLATYKSPNIGAVGGRALNNQPGEEQIGVEEIGVLKANGQLTGYFAADPGQTIEVDHIMGCNMSFRCKVLRELGGFREDYPGISGIREDTDMCLRVKRLGYKILFNPKAVVEHIGAPQAIGRRFDVRYAFYGAQNHCILLIRNYGPGAKLFRYLLCAAEQAATEFLRRIGGAFLRATATGVGSAVGIIQGLWLLCRHGLDPVRRDAQARSLTQALAPVEGSNEPSSAAQP